MLMNSLVHEVQRDVYAEDEQAEICGEGTRCL